MTSSFEVLSDGHSRPAMRCGSFLCGDTRPRMSLGCGAREPRALSTWGTFPTCLWVVGTLETCPTLGMWIPKAHRAPRWHDVRDLCQAAGRHSGGVVHGVTHRGGERHRHRDSIALGRVDLTVTRIWVVRNHRVHEVITAKGWGAFTSVAHRREVGQLAANVSTQTCVPLLAASAAQGPLLLAPASARVAPASARATS